LKDNFAKTYDEETETFTTVNKKDSIDDKDKLDYYKNLQKEIILLIYNKTNMFN
jgi:hypothetical protein